jgi:hypothetical protein
MDNEKEESDKASNASKKRKEWVTPEMTTVEAETGTALHAEVEKMLANKIAKSEE